MKLVRMMLNVNDPIRQRFFFFLTLFFPFCMKRFWGRGFSYDVHAQISLALCGLDCDVVQLTDTNVCCIFQLTT